MQSRSVPLVNEKLFFPTVQLQRDFQRPTDSFEVDCRLSTCYFKWSTDYLHVSLSGLQIIDTLIVYRLS